MRIECWRSMSGQRGLSRRPNDAAIPGRYDFGQRVLALHAFKSALVTGLVVFGAC